MMVFLLDGVCFRVVAKESNLNYHTGGHMINSLISGLLL